MKISPKYYNSLPKAQSLHEQEYAIKTRNGWEKVMQKMEPQDSL